jgi:hypothetical protein
LYDESGLADLVAGIPQLDRTSSLTDLMETAPESNRRLEGQKSSATHEAVLYKIQVMVTKKIGNFFMIFPIA